MSDRYKFADTLSDSFRLILRDLAPDFVHSKTSVIKILTHMQYLIFLSDNSEVMPLTDAEKYEYFDIARKEAVELYESRMENQAIRRRLSF